MVHVEGFDLKECPHCKGGPEFRKKDNYSAHTFWRVTCTKCGCGTYCDDDGYGYEDDPGKERAATEWNQRAEDVQHKLDVNYILENGKEISTKEATAGVEPIDWSKESFF